MPEDRKERVDRELIELLNELRVVLPGAQVLFAFLLVLPFTHARRAHAPSSATSTSPPSSARPSARRCSWRRPPTTACASASTTRSACCCGSTRSRWPAPSSWPPPSRSSCIVVTDVLFDSDVGGGRSPAVIAAWIVLFWYVLPLLQRRRRERRALVPAGRAQPAEGHRDLHDVEPRAVLHGRLVDHQPAALAPGCCRRSSWRSGRARARRLRPAPGCARCGARCCLTRTAR